MSFLSEIKVN